MPRADGPEDVAVIPFNRIVDDVIERWSLPRTTAALPAAVTVQSASSKVLPSNDPAVSNCTAAANELGELVLNVPLKVNVEALIDEPIRKQTAHVVPLLTFTVRFDDVTVMLVVVVTHHHIPMAMLDDATLLK